MKKKLVTAAFAMTLLLTGCGSSDDDKNVSKNTGKETFTVGMECNYAPFNWQTKEQTKTSVSIGGAGFCDGYDVRVARQIAKDLDREIVIKKVSWDGLQPALESGEIDAIIAGMTKDETRENGIDFTSPYYESEMVMIVRKGDKAAKFNDIQQFKGKTIIGVPRKIHTYRPTKPCSIFLIMREGSASRSSIRTARIPPSSKPISNPISVPHTARSSVILIPYQNSGMLS